MKAKSAQFSKGMDWLAIASARLSETAREAALARQANLTKPPGSLGRLEELAVWLAACQGDSKPAVKAPYVAVFAADHGVAAHGVSAFPAAVTGQMVHNFAAGGAAICALSEAIGACFEVVDVGTLLEVHPPGVVVDRVTSSSADMLRFSALEAEQLEHALEAGRRVVRRALEHSADLLILGEMGIGNTTAASAVAAALLGLSGSALAGPGTGLDQSGVNRKAEVVDRALEFHGLGIDSDPLKVLACVGGHELAALVGAYLSAAEFGLPVLIDGFICSASALVAARIRPDCLNWLLCAHASREPGHVLIVEALEQEPLLDLGLRLGEASGAATAVPLLQLACALHNSMTTFEDAGISEGS